MEARTKRQLGVTAALGAVVAVAAVVLSPAAVLRGVAGLADRPVVLGAALLALYLVRPLLAWPVSPISAFVGFVLGVTVGIPVALAGATLTAIPPFLLARHADTTGGPFGSLTATGRRVVDVTGEIRGVLAARLSPLPADPVSYGAGFAGVSTRTFVAGTLVGEIPWVVVEVLAGASMRQLALSDVSTGLHVLVVGFAAAILLVAGPAYRHWFDPSPEDPVAAD